jgi:hypothetical protein
MDDYAFNLNMNANLKTENNEERRLLGHYAVWLL